MNKEMYTKMVEEDIDKVLKEMPQSPERNHIIDVLNGSINNYFPKTVETLDPDKAGKYVIIDFLRMDFMKDENGVINLYDTQEEAGLTCGMYEFDNAWISKLIFNHIEEEWDDRHEAKYTHKR